MTDLHPALAELLADDISIYHRGSLLETSEKLAILVQLGESLQRGSDSIDSDAVRLHLKREGIDVMRTISEAELREDVEAMLDPSYL